MPLIVPNLVLNGSVLELIKSYPLGGGYNWPKESHVDGVTVELIYQLSSIAQPEPDKRTYCCGFTFEVWFRAMNLSVNEITGIDVKEMRRLKADWYVATGKRGGMLDALVPRGLGMEIENKMDAHPGDFVQFWRESGSGHSAIITEMCEESFRYFSTQTSTNGIGEKVELFSGARAVNEMHIVRAFRKRIV